MPRRLGDAAFQRVFSALVSDARSYRDGQLAPARVRQWRYFNGLVDAVPRRNRSRAIATEVRDTVEAVHAQLMKMFGASGNLVDYQATSALSQKQAEVATAYIHHIFLRENRGWTVLSDFFRDALVADFGVFHHRAEHEEAVQEEEYDDLYPADADAIASAPDVTVIERRGDAAAPADIEDAPAEEPTELPAGPQQYPGPGGPLGSVGPVSGGSAPGGLSSPVGGTLGGLPGSGGSLPTPSPPPAPGGPPAPPQMAPEPTPPRPPPPQPTVYLKIRRRIHGRTVIRVETVPPDEFLIDPAATTPDRAKIMAIDCTRSVGDLTAAGYSFSTVRAHAGTDRSETGERQARVPYSINPRDTTITDDETTYPVTLVQANVRVDTDGDGVPEIWRVTALGEDFTVVDRERTDVWEFTVGSPYNVPHAVIGTGVARQVMDLQDIQTAILRNQLDSLYQAVNPKFTALEGAVNLDDATDESFARIVRVRQPNAFAPLPIPFVGEQAFPMIERLDKIREFRTGVSPEAAGLDADALQSSTEVGVRAIVGQAQLRIETIARNFAENAITDLFRALLKLACRYQDRSSALQSANGFLIVDPTKLDPDLSVVPVVGLGNGTDQMKMMALAAVKQTQEQMFATFGPGNPLVGLNEYRNTLVDLLNLSPYRNPERYFKPLPPNIDQVLAQQSQQQAQSNPAQQAAQAEMMKAQAQVQGMQQKGQAQLQLGQQKAAAEQQRDQRKQAMEEQMASMRMQMERMEAMMRMQLEQEKARNEMQLDVAQMGLDAKLEQLKLAHQMATNAMVPNPSTEH